MPDEQENKQPAADESKGGIFEWIHRLVKERWPIDQIKIIRSLCPTETTNTHFAQYMVYCAELGLNPLVNEIHLEYRSAYEGFGENKTPVRRPINVVHIDAYKNRMAEMLDGNEQTPGKDEDGYYVDTVLYIKGKSRPITARAYYTEYSTGKGLWLTKKFVMTAKCSLAQACRLLGLFNNSYIAEEIERNDDEDQQRPERPANKLSDFAVAAKPAPQAPPAQAPPAPAPAAEPAPAAQAPQTPPAPQPPTPEPAPAAPEPTPAPANDASAIPASTNDAPAEPAPPAAPEVDPPAKEPIPIDKPPSPTKLRIQAEVHGRLGQQTDQDFGRFMMGFQDKKVFAEVVKGALAINEALDGLRDRTERLPLGYVSAYFRKNPIGLGQFAAFRIAELPPLEGWQAAAPAVQPAPAPAPEPAQAPPKTEYPNRQEVAALFARQQYSEDVIDAAAAYAQARGATTMQMRSYLNSLKGVKPSNAIAVKLALEIGTISDNAHRLMDAKEAAKEQSSDWYDAITRRLGKPILQATEQELDAILLNLPDSHSKL